MSGVRRDTRDIIKNLNKDKKNTGKLIKAVGTVVKSLIESKK